MMIRRFSPTRYTRRYIRDESGSNAVEAAFCFPIILLIIFACFQYGMFFQNSSDVNHTFDKVARDVVLLENPSQADIESLIGTYYSDQDNDVTYTVALTEKYDQNFADISVNYAYTVSLPFAKEYAMKTTYQNSVMLTTAFE